jgi:hypothetical protein
VSIVKRTMRFGGFPALRAGKFHFVWGFSKRKLVLFQPNGVDTKNGRCDLAGLNVGRSMFFYEVPAKV